MNDQQISRRDFLRLAGVGGGTVFASSLPGCAQLGSTGAPADFHFVQITDVHYGYDNPKVNPESKTTLQRTITAVNALDQRPDFVVFTGDLTQTTDDPKVRRQRLLQVRELASGLRVPKVVFMHGEHDAALDRGDAYREVFGAPLHFTFDHKGIHFIALDNTSDPAPIIGEAQLAWLKSDLARQSTDAPIVVLTHRPLFPLYPQWDWATRDGQAVLEALAPYRHVTVFYGHIHHEHHHRTGQIEHHAATAVMFPLSPVGSMPQKTQLPWDVSKPYNGLGFREVRAAGSTSSLRELPLART